MATVQRLIRDVVDRRKWNATMSVKAPPERLTALENRTNW
jgi:hypothetical protein